MSYFDLPRGEFELLLDDRGWTSVMFTDSLFKSDIASCIEDWSVKHKVLGARYNGKEVSIPKNYHWELRHKDELLGVYALYKDAKENLECRRKEYRKDKTIKTGSIKFVED